MLLITSSEVINQAFTPRETISPNSIRDLKIDIAQEHFIRPRLGQELYEELLDNRHADLIEYYIKPALAQFVRYGVIGELAIEVSDRGALIYSSSSGSVNDENNQTQNTTKEGQQTKESSSMDDSNDKQTIADTMTKTQEIIDERVWYKDPMDADRNLDNHRIQTQGEDLLSAERMTIGHKVSQGEHKLNTTDTEKQVALVSQNSVRKDEQLRAATPVELRILSQRALSDANILLAKAIRHIERNVERYPSYVSSNFSSYVFY